MFQFDYQNKWPLFQVLLGLWSVTLVFLNKNESFESPLVYFTVLLTFMAIIYTVICAYIFLSYPMHQTLQKLLKDIKDIRLEFDAKVLKIEENTITLRKEALAAELKASEAIEQNRQLKKTIESKLNDIRHECNADATTLRNQAKQLNDATKELKEKFDENAKKTESNFKEMIVANKTSMDNLMMSINELKDGR